MSSNLSISCFIAGFIIFLVTLQLLRRGRVPVKFSLLWFFSSLLLFFIALFPNVLDALRKLMGFQTTSNMLIAIFVFMLLFLTISLTVIVSGQKTKIQLLIQEISILKSGMDDENEN